MTKMTCPLPRTGHFFAGSRSMIPFCSPFLTVICKYITLAMQRKLSCHVIFSQHRESFCQFPPTHFLPHEKKALRNLVFCHLYHLCFLRFCCIIAHGPEGHDLRPNERQHESLAAELARFTKISPLVGLFLHPTPRPI